MVIFWEKVDLTCFHRLLCSRRVRRVVEKMQNGKIMKVTQSLNWWLQQIVGALTCKTNPSDRCAVRVTWQGWGNCKPIHAALKHLSHHCQLPECETQWALCVHSGQDDLQRPCVSFQRECGARAEILHTSRNWRASSDPHQAALF